MLWAICQICFFEWVRAFFVYGRSFDTGTVSTIIGGIF
jgi:hypothetical protein